MADNQHSHFAPSNLHFPPSTVAAAGMPAKQGGSLLDIDHHCIIHRAVLSAPMRSWRWVTSPALRCLLCCLPGVCTMLLVDYACLEPISELNQAPKPAVLDFLCARRQACCLYSSPVHVFNLFI